jgi:hypothetical protein
MTIQRCMVMDRHSAALALAGIIGSSVAVVHGVLTQRVLVEPFQNLAAVRVSATIQRLVAALLQFSTFNWFIGGLALVAAAYLLGREARLATGLLVGSSYLFAALGNLWATRGHHPGWVLYGVALCLIVYGLRDQGA